MPEKNIRLRILSHLVAAGAGGALAFVLMDTEMAPAPARDQQVVQQPKPVVEVPKIPVIAALPPPLDRAALIAAAAGAADAVASGTPLPQANSALVGRSFVLRMPFGCLGEMKEEAQKESWAGWRFNPKSRALRLTARATDLAKVEWMRKVAGEMAFDAVEGFWLRRPWTRAEQCGMGELAPSDAMLNAAGQRLAIAQFYSPESPRTLRRGDRPYSSTVKLEEGETPSSQGYQLQLEGKLSGFPDGQPVHCSQDNPSIAPRCVIAVEFERVAFVEPGNEEPIVKWQ